MRRTMKLKLLFVVLLLCCFAQGAKAQNYGSWNGLTQEEPPLKDKTTYQDSKLANLSITHIGKKYDNHYEHDKQAGIRTHQPG